jgi:hypothetical protein
MKFLSVVLLLAASLMAYGQVDPGSLASKANKVHTHVESDVTNLVSDLAGKAPASGIAESAITNLVSDLASKAPSSGIAESAVTNLTSDLAGKAALSHTHTEAQITNLVTDLALKAPSANAVFTGNVTFPITGSIQCMELSTAGVLHGTGSPCGTGTGGMTNPMTTQYDMILGGSGGTPSRLATQNNSILTTSGTGVVGWATAITESFVTNLTTDLAAKAPLNSPTLVTPVLGVASATTVNKVTLTPPATGATFTLVNGKTFTVNNTISLAATADGATVTFQGSDTYVGRTTTDTFTNKTFDTAGVGNVLKIGGTQVSAITGTGAVALASSPAFLGNPTAPTLATSDNSTGLSTTAWVKLQGYLTQAYSTVQANGTGVTQRGIVNFSSDFTTVDNAGSTRTDVSLAAIAESKVTSLVSDLAGKAAVSHTHTKSQITDFPVIAATLASATSKWLKSYDASTGLFTQTQPTDSDIAWAVTPTDAATANAIVKRDTSGNASFNSISTGTINYSGTGSWGAASPRVVKTDPTTGLSKVQFDADGEFYECTASGAGACSWYRLPGIVVTGTATLGNTSIAANTCNAAVTATATGALASHTVLWSYASAPSGTTDGKLQLNPYTAANSVGFILCNPTAGALVPTGLVVNWKVVR